MRQHVRIADTADDGLSEDTSPTSTYSSSIVSPPGHISFSEERHPHRSKSLDPRFLSKTIPVPEENKNRQRTLVLCFDGTGDCFDADNSNIVRFVSLLKKDDQKEQLVYYQVRMDILEVLIVHEQFTI